MQMKATWYQSFGGSAESFHSQIHMLPNITTASALGQSGIRYSLTSTSGCITKRTICATVISPKMALATRKPTICDFMPVSFRLLVLQSKTFNDA
jgi:hypothetical protein